MVNKKITELPTKSTPAAGDIVPIVDMTASPPATKKVTVGSLAVAGAAGPVGATGVTGPQGATGVAGLAGSAGVTGATGLSGVTGATGPRGLTWRGAWQAQTLYYVNDVVQYSGNSYVALIDFTGECPSGATPENWFCQTVGASETPISTTYLSFDPIGYPAGWSLLAAKGAAGVTGPSGPTGPAGSPLPTVIALTYAATLNTDAAAGDIFDATLTGNATLANPTNPVDGKTLRWRISQDGTGSRTVTLGNKFNIPSSATTPLPFSTAANKTDVLAATYHAGRDKWDVIAFVPGY